VSLVDLPRYDFTRPASLDEACALLAEREATRAKTVLLAGGTDFMVQVSQGKLAPEPLPLVVDVGRLDELRGVRLDGSSLRIGAAVTYLELQRDPIVREYAPLVAQMTHDIGGPTIQARGTLGGNLATASPAADGVAAIAAYDPIIEVQSVRGRRRIPMAGLQTGYKSTTRAADELIVAIELPLPAHGAAWCWRKVGTRLAQAISKVALGAVAELSGGKVGRIGLAMASVGPTTSLLPRTRALVSTTPFAHLTAATVDAAVAEDVSPIDDVRSTREYRIHTAKAVVRGFLRELGAPV
jgi:CO/xanthine dehydrogenase FAD-binding subunit